MAAKAVIFFPIALRNVEWECVPRRVDGSRPLPLLRPVESSVVVSQDTDIRFIATFDLRFAMAMQLSVPQEANCWSTVGDSGLSCVFWFFLPCGSTGRAVERQSLLCSRVRSVRRQCSDGQYRLKARTVPRPKSPLLC